MVANVAVRPEATNAEAPSARLSRRPGEANGDVAGFGASLQQHTRPVHPRQIASPPTRSCADHAEPKPSEHQPKPRDCGDAAIKPNPKRDCGDAEPVKDQGATKDDGTVCTKPQSATSPDKCAATETGEGKPAEMTAEATPDKCPTKDEILAVQTEFVPPPVATATPVVGVDVPAAPVAAVDGAELVPGYVEMLASAAGVPAQQNGDAGADGGSSETPAPSTSIVAATSGSGEAVAITKAGVETAEVELGTSEAIKPVADKSQAVDQAQNADTNQAKPKSAASEVTAPTSGESKGIGEAVSDGAKAKNAEKANGESGKPAVNHARPAFAEWVSELAHAQGAIHRSGDLVGALDRMTNPAAAPAQGQGEALRPTPLQMLPIEIGMQAMRGATQFQIRLDPAELGRVDVKLEIRSNGEVHANLVVDRVETLAMLKRDAQTLQYAFEQAGLKQSADGLTFSLRGEGQNGQHKQDGNGHSQGKQAADDETLKLQNQISELAMRRVMIPHASIDRVI